MRNSSKKSSLVHLNISDGRRQVQRMLPALDLEKKDGFKVAEMPWNKLLAMAFDYTQVMQFYNLKNEKDGSWGNFFSADETVVMADIVSFNPKDLHRSLEYKSYKEVNINIDELLGKLKQDPVLAGENKEKLNKAQFKSLFLAFVTLTIWSERLNSIEKKSEASNDLLNFILKIIQGLDRELYVLAKHLNDEFIEKIHETSFLWRESINLQKIKSSCRNDKTDIQSASSSLIKAIEMVQKYAEKLLDKTLSTGNHEPAVGLLIAFLQLFEGLNNQINRFTHNYIDFYYDQVLKIKARSLVPDSAYLLVKLSANTDKIHLTKDTEFLAGLDENKRSIIYTADEDVLISKATVSALHTLFFNRDPLSSPENSLEESICLSGKETLRQLATGFWRNDIPVLAYKDLGNNDKIHPNPLMGKPKSGQVLTLVNHARIGFALASKALLLHEGHRTVHITMKFDENASKDGCALEEWIKEITEAWQPDKDSNLIASITVQDTFLKVFRNIFTISLTTKSGWLEVPDYWPSCFIIDPTLEKNSVTIAFSLSADTVPIIPYSQAIHGEDYETQLPVVRFILNSEGYWYPYGMLSKLALKEIRIDVEVEGCRDLVLHNNIGQLPSHASFMPFGPIPKIGSYLIVGSPEAVGKRLVSFDVKVDWEGLPVGVGGFESYYQGYEKPVNSKDFKASASVLINGKWLPEGTSARVITPLFRCNSDDDGNEVSSSSRLSCEDLKQYYSQLDNQGITTESNYTTSSKKGFFKFTLVSPAGAFGHRDYSRTLTKVLTDNAKQKLFKQPKEVPNEPYTPVISSITVSYKAFSEIAIGGKEEEQCLQPMKEKLIYLHPLGWTNSELGNDQQVFLLPQYEYSGNLFIGLKAAKMNGIITLYFYLREDSLPIRSKRNRAIHWFYLSDNQWKPFQEEHILADSSQGFMTSGIVTLIVPSDITQGNSVMPKELFWLRVSAEYDLEKFCSLYAVYSGAIKVTRRIDESVLAWNSILLAGSITRSIETIPGLESIMQVQPSFGGLPVENREDLRARISGRLKHKNRLVTSTDYELLILERFPQIYKVKCFVNMTLPPDSDLEKSHCLDDWICPGSVLIVPLPDLTQGNQKPMLSGHLINEVKEFIAKLASPFVTLDVINPVYEEIQVRCTVKFKTKSSDGFYINRLNQAISDYISPWNHEVGYTAHFGWTVRAQDLESYIRTLDYIDGVTNLSLLRIVPVSDNCFNLFDSARTLKIDPIKDIAPTYPWGVLVPIKQHFIEVKDSIKEPIPPEITGIDELEIGSTFIVSEKETSWREKIEKH